MQLGASLVMEIDRCIPDLNSGVLALPDDLDPMLLRSIFPAKRLSAQR